MLNELAEPRLVNREKDEECPFLTIDKSLQILLLLKLNKDRERRHLAFEGALDLLKNFVTRPSLTQQSGSDPWTLTLKILPHLRSLVEAYDRAQPRIEASSLFAEFLIDVSKTGMVDRGYTKEARLFLEKAEEALDDPDELDLCSETIMRVDILTTLGLCSDKMGISERAKAYDIRQKNLETAKNYSKAIPEEVRMRRHEMVLNNAKMELAYSMQSFNRMQDVARICHEYHAECQHWGREDEYPNEYAKYYNRMAYVYLHKGDTEKAAKSSERAYRLIAQKSPDAYAVARFRFDWATIMFQDGQTDCAIEEHKSLLHWREQVCGKSNVLTLQSRLSIGIMYCLIGDMPQAEYEIPDVVYVYVDQFSYTDWSLGSTYGRP